MHRLKSMKEHLRDGNESEVGVHDFVAEQDGEKPD
jgi:hypothetical protein